MAFIDTLKHVVRRRDLLAIFAMVFMADVAIGIYRVTFSLFATSLGASLTLVGILSGLEGFIGILLSVPLGMLSDRIDRKIVLGGGLLLFIAGYLGCSLVTTPALLVPIRILSGVAVVSTFYVGIAIVGDTVEQQHRGLSIGLYTTCMGVGFAIGSATGGRIAQELGYDVAFRVAALVSVVSFVLLRWAPAHKPRQALAAGPGMQAQRGSNKLALLSRNPGIVAACAGNMMMSVVNDGAIYGFFPLYAASLTLSQAVIGSLFSVRMISSSSARLPSGALAPRLSSKRLMVAALTLSMTCVFAIGFSTSPAVLAVLLAGEGAAFGMYFASGTTAIAEYTTEDNRGTATGLFLMAGSIGTTVGPIGLGAAADAWGLNTVFWFTAAALFVGLTVSVILYSRMARKVRRCASLAN
jgi:MFS family permease